jgi:undecaprenyl phosphate-alpha-L-ara4FN deformylase
MKLALRIEVATLRGTRDAVPRLMRLLKEFEARATFLFTLGPDHTGRAIGSLPRVPRRRCYGLATLLSGTLLPAPDIGARCASTMRGVLDEGFEAGIQAYDRAAWVNRAGRADEAWTRLQMQRARARFEEIFGAPALGHGAAGWQMNRYAWRALQRLGFRYGSDTVGTCPFVPIMNAEIIGCPQLPTTLPTLDEVARATGAVANEDLARHLLEITREPPAAGHVYTLRAEVEGTLYAPALRSLLCGWRSLGYQLVALEDYAAGLEFARLPRHVIVYEPIPGSRRPVAMQGTEFLAEPGSGDPGTGSIGAAP